MIVPKQYEVARGQLDFDSIDYNFGGIHLFSLEELPKAQVGYSVSVDGESFCDGEPGSWQKAWITIGYETGMGDPILLDSATKKLRVLTDVHGQGSWEPTVLSESLEGFLKALTEFRIIAKGRQNPAQLEKNPLSPQERADVLDRICETDTQVDRDYWEAIFYDDAELA